MLNACSVLLKHELGGAEGLITAYHGRQDVMLHCKEWSVPKDAEDEYQMACDRWVNADHLLTVRRCRAACSAACTRRCV